MKTGRWSKEEDETLKEYVNNYGFGCSWQSLAINAGLRRCGRSCRSRWLNYLRPGLKHGNFTKEEDGIIMNLYNKVGSSWSKIAAALHGRTDLAVKNYWNTKFRRLSSRRRLLMNAKPGQIPSPAVPKIATGMEKLETSLVPGNGSGEGSSALAQDDESMEMVWELIEKLASELASAPRSQPPDFAELMNWYIMSPSHDSALEIS